MVQYFPYQSLRRVHFPELLPSQRFSFSLVEKAIDAGKLIVVMRSRRHWLKAVPKLAAYGFSELRNPRSPYVTPNNMGQEQFDRLLARLESNALAGRKAQGR